MAARRALAAVSLAIAALLAGCSPDPEPPAAPPTLSTEVARPEVVLDGIYRLDMLSDQNMTNGAPDPQQAYTRNYALRGNCSDSGCVATLSRAEDDNPDGDRGKLTPLDYIGDQWIMTDYRTQQCPDGSSAAMVIVWQLDPQPDGTLTGTRTAASFGERTCSLVLETPMTLTRIGDIGSDVEIDDPATLEPRRQFAAAGLAGTYDINAANSNGGDEATTAAISTFCARTADRCLTMFGDFDSRPEAVVPMLFADGMWTSVADWPDPACEPPPFDPVEPEPAETKTSLQLPEPTPNPITTVTGFRSTYDRACFPSTTDRQLTLTRTGD